MCVRAVCIIDSILVSFTFPFSVLHSRRALCQLFLDAVFVIAATAIVVIFHMDFFSFSLSLSVFLHFIAHFRSRFLAYDSGFFFNIKNVENFIETVACNFP